MYSWFILSQKHFRARPPTRFIRDILVQSFKINHLIIGYDHRFALGATAEATVEDLIHAGDTYGFTVEKIEAQRNCIGGQREFCQEFA